MADTKLPGKKKRTKEVQQFIDTVEAAPGAIAEGVEELAGSAVDFLVGRDTEAEEEGAALDAELESLAGQDDQGLDAELESLAGPGEVDPLDAELEALAGEAEPVEEEGPGIGGKILGRLVGNDVDDPMPFVRLGTTVTGAIAGGVVGAKLGAAAGTVLGLPGAAVGGFTGAVLGTAGGAIAPETIQRLAEFTGIIDEDSEFSRKNMGLNPDDLQTVLEGEVLLELATGGGIAAARLLTRQGTRLFVGAGKEELLLAKRARARGIDLLPVQVGKRVIPRAFVVIMGRFPLIVGPLKKAGGVAEQQIAGAISTLSTRLAPIQRTADELGLAMFREAKGLATALTKDFNKRYDAVYDLADEFNVRVMPKKVISKATQIIHNLKANAPRVLNKKGELVPGLLSKTNQEVVEFLTKNILPVKGVPQTFRQMDTLVTNIDEFLALLEPGQKKFARSLATQLRQQAVQDMVQNAKGVNAGEIAQRLRNVDKDFSFMMTDLFETSLAKQIASFTKKGLRGSVADPVTRLPVDTMAKIIKLESPEAMSDLAKLVSKDTYASIVSKVMDDAVSTSLVETGEIGKRFDVAKFKRTLGLDNVKSSKFATLKKMLKTNGTITTKELQDVVEAATAIEGLAIPSASSFVARRVILGGAQSFVGAILPGVTAGTVARGGSGFGIKTLFAVSVFLFGGRGFMSAISDPKIIQPLRDVMSEEVSDVIRRSSYIKIVRLLISASFGDEDEFVARIGGSKTKTKTMKESINQMFDLIVQSLDEKVKSDK